MSRSVSESSQSLYPRSAAQYTADTSLLMPQPSPQNDTYIYSEDDALTRRPTEVLTNLRDYPSSQPYEIVEDDYWEDEDEDDETRFVNFAMLSHMAVQLRDKVPRGTHVKGSIPYSRAFTGKDIVVSTTCG